MKNAIHLSLPPDFIKTRIMATVGRKALEYEELKAMVKAGATFFRFNGAHITEGEDTGQENLSREEAMEIANSIRRLRSEYRQLIGIYFDLGGPKIRVLHVISVKADTGDRQAEGKGEKSQFNKPEIGEEVIVHIRDPRGHGEITSFVKGVKDVNWREGKSVNAFFKGIGKTERNEIVLTGDVHSADEIPNGSFINLKDGWCKLKVEEARSHKGPLRCTVDYVDQKFTFRPEQAANPHQHIFKSIVTAKDKRDVGLALKMGADIISLSFVCATHDAVELRNAIGASISELLQPQNEIFLRDKSPLYRRYLERHEIPIFAKIETAYAVDPLAAEMYAKRKHLERYEDPLRAIAEEFDGLMVARGDLAVELEKYQVPYWQRQIIRTARLNNKPVIVATEMLESIKRGDTSTRAEINDINLAVHQEADILMLSGETASPVNHPWEAVAEMRRAIVQAEQERAREDKQKNFEVLEREREAELNPEREDELKRKRDNSFSERNRKSAALSSLAQGSQVCVSARALKSKVIITSVNTGQSAMEVAYYRPSQKILALTDDVLTGVRLLQHRGVYPIVLERPLKRTLAEFTDILGQVHFDIGIPTASAEENPETTFRVPGLIRVTSELDALHSEEVPLEEHAQSESHKRQHVEESTPNSLHVFRLPTKKTPPSEIERKYLVLQEDHERLLVALQNEGKTWVRIQQDNYYFTDLKNCLYGNKTLLRIRKEKELAKKEERSTSKRPTSKPGREFDVYFTIKQSGELDPAGEDRRDEIEHDITQEFGDFFRASKEQKVDFDKLPDFYKETVWNRCSKVLEGRYSKYNDIAYRQIAHMKNFRSRFEMWNGFVLEVDEAYFADKDGNPVEVGYEMEIELRYDPTRTLNSALDEYIKDKFGRLGIPYERVDRGGDWKDYPTKALQAFAFAGLEDESILVPLFKAREKLARSKSISR